MSIGTNPYQIRLLQDVIDKDLPALTSVMRQQVKTAIYAKLTLEPTKFGKPLRANWRGHYRLRVGKYRIIYRVIAEDQEVLVVAIDHRGDVYE